MVHSPFTCTLLSNLDEFLMVKKPFQKNLITERYSGLIIKKRTLCLHGPCFHVSFIISTLTRKQQRPFLFGRHASSLGNRRIYMYCVWLVACSGWVEILQHHRPECGESQVYLFQKNTKERLKYSLETLNCCHWKNKIHQQYWSSFVMFSIFPPFQFCLFNFRFHLHFLLKFTVLLLLVHFLFLQQN